MKLHHALKRLSGRYRLRLFLRRLPAALAGTIAAGGLLLLAGPFAGLTLAALPVVAGALAAGLALALVLALLAPGGPETASRFLEARDPALHEKLSTALELEKRGETRGLIREAQLRDAARTALQLDPRERIPLAPPRGPLAWLGTACLVLAAGVFLQPAGAPGAEPLLADMAPAQTEMGGDEQARFAAQLQDLAELFGAAEAEEEDPYLKAITRELEQLSQRVADENLTREETAAELERLLQHTRTALEVRETPEQLQDLPDFLEAALQELLEPAEALAEASGEEAGEAAADAEAAAPGEGAGPSLPDLADPDADNSEAATASAAGDAGDSGSYYEMTLDDETIAELAARALEQAEGAPDGEIIGASDESGAGDSQLAGEGTQDLFGEDGAGRLAVEEIEQLDVPQETNPDGRRVRVEVAPEAELTEVRMTPLGQMTWNRSSETVTEREYLSTGSRSLVARFHLPEQGR